MLRAVDNGSSRRADGRLRPHVTMWMVWADGDLYVRSAYGPDNPWYRRAVGRIRVGGIERDVSFAQADRTEAMYASAADDELHFQQFLSANCFGDYYTRGGIDVRTCELLTFAMLASLGGCDPQVKGHVAAKLNVGNGRQMLISVITVLLPFIGYPRTLNALAAINEIMPASREGH
jgi:alkylhydroperoxidase/carboxymuconolactone decarboxylase family protein YurZ